jgi:diguanylate cyclase (GGDEF)-like protein
MGAMNANRSRLLVPLVVLLLTVGAITSVWLLVQRADTRREAQLQIATMKLSLAELQSAPFSADRSAGGSATAVRATIEADEASLSQGLTTRSQAGVPSRLLDAGRSSLGRIEPVVTTIFRTALERGGLSASGSRAAELAGLLGVRSASLTVVLDQISGTDAAMAADARTQGKLGAAGAMLLLLLAFAYFYFRSLAAREVVERLAHEKESLLGLSREEARTDPLTHLGNRRALASDLASALAQRSESHELLLAIFDLDGFKHYNDSFGHAAGDALLLRLGRRFAAAVEGFGFTYRLGGDEFCMFARGEPDVVEQLLEDSVAALTANGEDWQIACSEGSVWMPSEASTQSQALRLADERMYANKATRSSGSQQLTEPLPESSGCSRRSRDRRAPRVADIAGSERGARLQRGRRGRNGAPGPAPIHTAGEAPQEAVGPSARGSGRVTDP